MVSTLEYMCLDPAFKLVLKYQLKRERERERERERKVKEEKRKKRVDQ